MMDQWLTRNARGLPSDTVTVSEYARARARGASVQPRPRVPDAGPRRPPAPGARSSPEQIRTRHGSWRVLSEQDVADIYLMAYDLGASPGGDPCLEVHISMWSETPGQVSTEFIAPRDRGGGARYIQTSRPALRTARRPTCRPALRPARRPSRRQREACRARRANLRTRIRDLDPAREAIARHADWSTAKRIETDPLVTHRLDLDRIKDGFERMKSGRSIRAVVPF